MVTSFTRNSFGVASPHHFDAFAGGTEAMIFARVAKSERDGIFSNGGLLLFDSRVEWGVNSFPLQRKIYVEHLPFEEEWVYRSNPGVQGMLFSMIDRISPFPNEQNITLFHYISALISATVFTALLAWVIRTFSLFTGLITAAGLLCSNRLVVSGGHIYWISGILFLSVLVCLLQLEKMDKNPGRSPWHLFGWVALAFFIKGEVTGFEIATTTMVATTIPVFFYAVYRAWPWRTFLRRFLQVSAGVFAGLILTSTLLLYQISFIPNVKHKGIGYLKERLEVRTTGGRYQGNAPEYLQESFDASHADVFKKYMHPAVVSLPTVPPFSWIFSQHMVFPLWAIALGGILITVGGLFLRKRTAYALMVATWTGTLSILSWMILFKSHSYLHLHLNFLGWYLPFLFFLYILVGYVLEKWFIQIGSRWKNPAAHT